jgi:hypothetical protein
LLPLVSLRITINAAVFAGDDLVAVTMNGP